MWLFSFVPSLKDLLADLALSLIGFAGILLGGGGCLSRELYHCGVFQRTLRLSLFFFP